MRLYPVAATEISRVTPLEGIMIGETFIPGDTKVIAPRWVIFRREFSAKFVVSPPQTKNKPTDKNVGEDCFERATDFVPERWYEEPAMVKRRNAFAPSGIGK